MNTQVNWAPPSSLLPTLKLPCIFLLAAFAIASPSPKPPVFRLRLLSKRAKGKNIVSNESLGIPGPSSSTLNEMLFSIVLAEITILALDSKHF